MLTPTHLQKHGITPNDYKSKYGPTTSLEFTNRHSEKARKIRIEWHKTHVNSFKGKTHSPEWRTKKSEQVKTWWTEERKIAQSNQRKEWYASGKIKSWRLGKTKETDPRVAQAARTLSQNRKRLFSEGIWIPPNRGKKLGPLKLQTRIKKSAYLQGIPADQWKGFKQSENQRARETAEYTEWRKKVFIRDNFTCQFCKKRGGQLQADHIKSFSLHVELRLDVDNGRTLCVECHKKTDTYGSKSHLFKLKNLVK